MEKSGWADDAFMVVSASIDTGRDIWKQLTQSSPKPITEDKQLTEIIETPQVSLLHKSVDTTLLNDGIAIQGS